MKLGLAELKDQMVRRGLGLTTAADLAGAPVAAPLAGAVPGAAPGARDGAVVGLDFAGFAPAMAGGRMGEAGNGGVAFDLPTAALVGVHEWFLDERGMAGTVESYKERDQTLDMWRPPRGSAGPVRRLGWGKEEPWFAPLTVMAVTAALRARQVARGDANGWGAANKFVWVGRACWPSAALLAETQRAVVGGGGWVRNNIYVDATTADERVWAIAQAAACGQVAAVIADGSGLADRHLRKIQLAAEGRAVNEPNDRGVGAAIGGSSSKMILLARPPQELGAQSLAWARWLVRPVVSLTHLDMTTRLIVPAAPRWRVAWLGGKGPLQTCGASLPRWMELEWVHEVDDGAGALRVSADVGSGSGQGENSKLKTQNAKRDGQNTKRGVA